MNVRKRGLALLMCICMIFTLLPFSALADNGTGGATEPEVVYGNYNGDYWEKDNNNPSSSEVTEETEDGNTVKLSKTATPVEGQENTYNIELKVVTTQTTNNVGAATVLVMDVSGSMNEHKRLENAIKEAKTFLLTYSGATKDDNGKIILKDTSKGETGLNRFVSVVAFNEKITSDTNWYDVSTVDGYNAVTKIINKLEAEDGTNLDLGLRTANAMFTDAKKNKDVKDITTRNVIALTDGVPTFYYGGHRNGDHGTTGCPITNDKTEAAADTLKATAKIYTVCYGAQDDKCWQDWKYVEGLFYNYYYFIDKYGQEKSCKDSGHAKDGPTVGDFLRDSIATPATSDTTYAYNAKDDSSELETAFRNIATSITQGIKDGIVIDPMGDHFTVKDAPENFIATTEGYKWELKDPAIKTVNGKTTYTYTLTYTVKLDNTFAEFDEETYYPTNRVTTFTPTGIETSYKFKIPGVKGTAPSYKVTYQYTNTPTGAPNVPTDTNEYKAGDTVTVKLAPTLDGYTFSGWQVASDSPTTPTITDNGQFNMPNGNVVLEGSWTKRTDLSYTVHHYLNGTTERAYPDETVSGQTFNTTVTVDPKEADANYTPVSTEAKQVTITTETNENVVTFYYYQNVTLTANSKTVTYNGEEQIVSGFTGAPEGADFSAIEVGAKGIQPNTYPANFAEGTKGTVDATGKYIVTDVVNGNLVIEAAYQVQYEYKNAPADAPACPTDDTYYADNTTVTLRQPGTAPTGYKFVGWKVDGTGDVVTEVTINGANVRLVGEWEPVTGLSYVVHYYWVGTEDKVAPDKIVDKQTFGTVITSETPIQVPNYKAVPDQVSNLKISTENEMNVITFYYYKNIELTANNGEAKYDGTLKTVDGFKAIVAADNGADIYEQLKEVLAAHGQGTDAGRYDVYFTKGGEIIPATDLVGRVLNDRYWVTKAEQGKLTISPRSLTITSGSDSKYYDGTPLTNDKITVTGDGFVNGEGATYKVTGSQTEVGSSKNTFDVIFKDNTKATNYVVEKKLGDLTVNRRPMPPVNPGIGDEIIVEITGNSDSVVYDGAEHSVKGYTVKISDPRYTEKDFTFTGKAEASGVNAGTYEMGLKAEQFKNTNARFTNVKFVIKADGVLTITPKDLTITAGSKTEYGPTPVTCGEWTVSGLVAGDKVESVKITGIQSVPGSSPNVPSDAVIKNAKGEDVTKNYAIKYVNGTLTMLEVLNKEDHFNYIIGTPEGLSLPTANVTRAEVATIFFRLMTDDARAKFDSLDNSFSDVAKGKWYNRAISTLANAGIIKGDPAGTYRPDDPITRAEMAAIIARFGDFKEGGKTFNDISGHWAQKYIELAASNGWINGNPDGTFKPNNNITRAETVAMINRVLDRQTKDVSDLLPVAQMTNWSDNMDTAKWYYRDMQEATNNHKAERVGNSIYEKWTEKLPDIDWASYQI